MSVLDVIVLIPISQLLVVIMASERMTVLPIVVSLVSVNAAIGI